MLTETSQLIKVHSLREECPTCGALLAETLRRRAVQPLLELAKPRFQTADSMLKFRFGIAKIDGFLRLGTADLCCVIGPKANLILTRLCVRALLPTRHGGLDSPFVMVADAGNRSDVYGAVNFARQYGMRKDEVADRILVTRPFTIYQLKRLLATEMPKVIQKYQVKLVVIPGLLDLFDDPNIKNKEAKKQISRMVEAINDASGKVLVVASIQEGKYTDLVSRNFKKQMKLTDVRHGRLAAELYNHGERRNISLVEKDLKIVTKG